MPKACFKSMTFKSAAHASNSTLHNNRDTIPDYLVEPKRDNFYEMRTNPMQLLDEIKRNSQRLGKQLNARAKPLREAVILLNDDHDITDVKSCINRLHKELNMRPLWIAIHEDEGHIDKKSGEVVYNRHVHFGYTNYDTENHRCHDMNRTVMTKAQNIVAEQLDMERGRSKRETGVVGLDHKTYRAVARKQAVSRDRSIEDEKRQAKLLAEENKAIREKLKASGSATREDYQELNRLKKSEMDLQEKLQHMQDLLDEVQARNKALEEQVEAMQADFDKRNPWRKEPLILGQNIAGFGAELKPKVETLARKTLGESALQDIRIEVMDGNEPSNHIELTARQGIFERIEKIAKQCAQSLAKRFKKEQEQDKGRGR